MAAGQGYEINQHAVIQLLYGKTVKNDMVPIYPALRRRAEAVERRAKVLVGKKTGALMRSIHTTDYRSAGYLWFRIGSDNPIALLHHRGTRRHLIEGPVSFNGRTYARVNHPGTRPNPYLRDALPAFLSARDTLPIV